MNSIAYHCPPGLKPLKADIRGVEAPPSRRAAVVHRPRRLPLPTTSPTKTPPDIAILECRHRQHAHVETGPRRQGHQPREVPVQRVRLQRGAVGDRDARNDLIVWTQAPSSTGTWPRPNRSESATACCTSPLDPAFPAAADAPPARHVALGRTAQDSVRAPQSAPSRHRLTTAHGHLTPPSSPPGPQPRHRCRHTGKPSIPDSPPAPPAPAPSRPPTSPPPSPTAPREPPESPYVLTARSGLTRSPPGAGVICATDACV